MENPDVRNSIKDYCDEEAYICHSRDHWLAIRQVAGVWYNLNSTNMMPPGPQVITKFNLSLFLESIGQSGYTIFVIRKQGRRPNLPIANKSTADESLLRDNQHYISAVEIDKYH